MPASLKAQYSLPHADFFTNRLEIEMLILADYLLPGEGKRWRSWMSAQNTWYTASRFSAGLTGTLISGDSSVLVEETASACAR